MQRAWHWASAIFTLALGFTLWGCNSGGTSTQTYPGLTDSDPTITYGSGAGQVADTTGTYSQPFIVIFDHLPAGFDPEGQTVQWYLDLDRDGDPDDSFAGQGSIAAFFSFKLGTSGSPDLPDGFADETDEEGRSIVYYSTGVPWPHNVMAYSPDFDRWVVIPVNGNQAPTP